MIYQFFSLRKENADFDLMMDKVTLQKSTNTTYLSVVLDNKLNFTDHVNAVKDKVQN